MASVSLVSLIFIITLHSLTTSPIAAGVGVVPDNLEVGGLQTFIVRVRCPNTNNLNSCYNSFLPATTSENRNEEQSGYILYRYRHVLTGFAANLSPEEVKEMENRKGFVSAKPEKFIRMHTTHSPAFLGLNQNYGFWKNSNFGKGIIIGVVDSGITPNHPSFNDSGMPPPPSRWKGSCFNFTCNNKLIGAKFFGTPSNNTLDEGGHGTHTASTAAGNFVPGANVLGQANGTAAGIAPLAYLAIYKACLESNCSESGILAAIDAAVEDGVDVISLSIGDSSENGFYDDNIAIASFGAIQKGIFVSAAVGNTGPSSSTLENDAPWILSVGASTINRKVVATAVLGNNQQFDGESLFQPKSFPLPQLPLVYPALLNASDLNATYCYPNSLSNYNLSGKIVLCWLCTVGCDPVTTGQNVKNAGGAGMIVVNLEAYANVTLALAHVLPATLVGFADGQNIINYIKSTTNPTSTIVFKGTIIGDPRAPVVAPFSSRGPSKFSPGILKPDIIGPGVNILAAWPKPVGNNANTNANFNIMSGTSMACPHLSGVAALLKSAHPDWSPAAIKSAMMTTTNILNRQGLPIEDQRYLTANVFATGAGEVNPTRANYPGLIYDIKPEDYIPYLCGLNYTDKQVGDIVRTQTVNCSQQGSIPEAQLNYPSFSVTLAPSSLPQTYSRTVTNVGSIFLEIYTAQTILPPLEFAGFEVTVEPSTLTFLLESPNQKATYNVTFNRLPGSSSGTFQGYLEWRSLEHLVRTPISVVLT